MSTTPNGQWGQPGPANDPQQSWPTGAPQQGSWPQGQYQQEAWPQGQQNWDGQQPGEYQAADPQQLPPSTRPVGHDGVRVDIVERPAGSVKGIVSLLIILGLWVVAGLVALMGVGEDNGGLIAGAVVLAVVALVVGTGLRVVNPGDAKVIQFFGHYKGTIREPGLHLTAPFTTGRRISVKASNFETAPMKVNDSNGNPIEIGAIVVYQVADTAKAAFAVEDYDGFVTKQAESALRHVAMSHPYDDHSINEDGQSSVVTLRESTEEVNQELAAEVAERVAVSGVEVIEVRIAHLAYAQEIASAMLRRQQAQAILSARQVIVRGATEMAKQAVRELDETSDIELDPERKAAMISNLLVVLCSEQNTQPVINTGSLY